jgi:hypothetical protein
MKAYILYPLAAVITFAIGIGIACKPPKVAAVPETPVNRNIPESIDPSPIDRGKETYKVYSALLNQQWKGGNVVIRNMTDRGLFASEHWLDDNVGLQYPEAVADFKKVNENSVQLSNHFDYDGKLVLIDQEEFKTTIGGGDGWNKFKNEHPGATGIITFSAVGFDASGTTAVVNVMFVCAGLCGNGNVYILEKKDGNWTLKQTVGAVIS